MATAHKMWPGPNDVVLHACGGVARFGLSANCEASCATCGAPILPEQPFRDEHAYVHCGYCSRDIGLCGRSSLDDLFAEAYGVMNDDREPVPA